MQSELLDQAFVVTFLQPMDEVSLRESGSRLVNRETGQPFPLKLTWDKEFVTWVTIEPVGRYKIASFYNLTIVDHCARQRWRPSLQQGLQPAIWDGVATRASWIFPAAKL